MKNVTNSVLAEFTTTVLVVSPGQKPKTVIIPSGLESLQKWVGGYIEAIYPFDDPVAIVCNEEGKINGLPLNRALRDREGNIYDIVAGTFLVVGLGEEDFCSLTPEQVEKYSEYFKEPEDFFMLEKTLLNMENNFYNNIRW